MDALGLSSLPDPQKWVSSAPERKRSRRYRIECNWQRRCATHHWQTLLKWIFEVLTYTIKHLCRRRGTWRNKAHADPVTSGSALLYYYSACLCFDLFKSLFKGCVFLCLWAARALQEQPAEWAHLGSPQSDLQSYCIKRTVFITALHTNLFYLLHGEHNPSSNSSAPPLGTLKSLLGTTG